MMEEEKKNKDREKDKETTEEIRKEIEKLDKMIRNLKEQKKDEEKKGRRYPVLKVNLASVYSLNPYINIIIGFLINFITIFFVASLMGKLFFAISYNDIELMFVVFGFSLYEELYKNYLFKKHMSIVIYSVGTIFFLMNIFYFYLTDYLFFGFRWFISAYHPILFVVTFLFFRFLIKALYKQLELLINRKSRR